MTAEASNEPEEPGAYERRARVGRIALVVRTAIAQVAVFGGTIVLARALRPEDFGVFVTVQFVLTVITLVGDGGLGGALVQRKEAPSQRVLSSVFWAQMALAAAVVLVASGVGHGLRYVWSTLPPEAPWLVLALAVNFVLVSARVVPTLLLERELRFVPVAVLETVGLVAYNGTASVLALLGYGVWALVAGVVAQGALSLGVALALRPWRPSFQLDVAALRPLLRFGVPYQARGGMTLLTRSSIPVIAGTLLGSHAVGVLNWALETAFFPLTFVEIIMRVSFPLYSRLQGDPPAFAAELEKSTRLAAAITFCLSSLFFGLGLPLTDLVFSATWVPSVPLLSLYAIAVNGAVLVYLLSPALDALGKPEVVFLQLGVIAGTVWALGLTGATLGGELGFAIGYGAALLLGACFVAVTAARHLPGLRLGASGRVPLLAACFVAALGRLVLAPLVVGPVSLVLAIAASVVVYLAVLWALDKKTFEILRASAPRLGGPRTAPAGA